MEKEAPLEKNDHYLVLETQGKDQVYLYANEKGVKFLIENLQALLKNAKEGRSDHGHMFSSEWGGYELSTEKPSKDGEVVHHLKYHYVKGNKN